MQKEFCTDLSWRHLSPLTLSQGCADTFRGLNALQSISPWLALHPKQWRGTRWSQLHTCIGIQLHAKLSGSIPWTRAKLKIEPLWNSPTNGLSASTKPTAVYLNTLTHTAHSREEFPSTFHVHRHVKSKKKKKTQKTPQNTNTGRANHPKITYYTFWRRTDSIGVTAEGIT